MRGGFDVVTLKDTDFRYTRSAQRIDWTKNAYSIGPYFIDMIRSIRWNEYGFKGDATFTSPAVLVEGGKKIKETEVRSIPVTASLSGPFSFYFFGGCVYEILNSELPTPPPGSRPSLRDYVDPTGDVDVLVSMPTVRFDDKTIGDEVDDYFLKPGDDGTPVLNEVLDDYSKWLLTQIQTWLEELQKKPIFDRLFGNTVAFDHKANKNDETFHADISVRIGNLWLVRVPLLDSGMLKIQIAVQFEGTEPDHILECVIPIESKPENGFVLNRSVYEFQKKYFVLNETLPLQSYCSLIEDNRNAMLARYKFAKDEDSRHKFFNHIGRMQYLNQLFQFINPGKTTQKECPPHIIADFILTFLYSFGELRKDKDFPTSVLPESITEHLINLLYTPPRTDRSGKPIAKKLIQDSVYIEEKRTSVPVEEILTGLTLPMGGTRRRRSQRNKSRRRRTTCMK